MVDARKRALEAVRDWTEARGYGSPVVTGYVLIAEILNPDGKAVVWISGDGAAPTIENEAGLMRWEIRGLLSEVESHLHDGSVTRDGEGGE